MARHHFAARSMVTVATAVACTHAIAPAQRSPGSSPPSPRDLYLAPEHADGDPLCFDPSSPALRRLLANARGGVHATVAAAAMADDIDELRRLMRRYYPGWAALVALPDFDVETFFDARIAALRAPSAAPVRVGAVVGEVLTTLRIQNPDNHLWTWGEDKKAYPDLEIAEYQAPWPTTRDGLRSCRFARPDLVYAQTFAVASIVSVREGTTSPIVTVSAHGGAPAIEMTCGERKVTLSRRPPPRREPSDLPAYEWRTVGDTAIVRVRRLMGDATDMQRLEGIARDYARHATSKAVVFDLRGNGGGSDDYVAKWIEQAHRGRVCGSTVEYVPPWSLARCSFWNGIVALHAQDGTLDTDASRATRSATWAAIDRYRREVRFGTSFGCEELSAKSPFEGRVLALVDRRTASSGESSAFMLADALGASIVGERTDGAVEFGNVRVYLLPRTGALVQFGGKRSISREPREGVGLAVELYLDEVFASDEKILTAIAPLLARRRLPAAGAAPSSPPGERP